MYFPRSRLAFYTDMRLCICPKPRLTPLLNKTPLIMVLFSLILRQLVRFHLSRS